MRCLTQHTALSEQELVTLVARDAGRVHKNLVALIKRGL